MGLRPVRVPGTVVSEVAEITRKRFIRMASLSILYRYPPSSSPLFTWNTCDTLLTPPTPHVRPIPNVIRQTPTRHPYPPIHLPPPPLSLSNPRNHIPRPNLRPTQSSRLLFNSLTEHHGRSPRRACTIVRSHLVQSQAELGDVAAVLVGGVLYPRGCAVGDGEGWDAGGCGVSGGEREMGGEV